MAEVRVEDNREEHRFEAFLDDRLAGFTAYDLDGRGITLLHTEVDDAFAGQGVGSAMTRQVLDRVRAEEGLELTVLCPFVNAWLRRHPDYRDLTRR